MLQRQRRISTYMYQAVYIVYSSVSRFGHSSFNMFGLSSTNRFGASSANRFGPSSANRFGGRFGLSSVLFIYLFIYLFILISRAVHGFHMRILQNKKISA